MTNLKIDINKQPVFLIDGLTLDDLKSKYGWIFNARIKNAVLGERNNKLAWYTGEWIYGEWYDGIWFSGIWYDGIWRNGDWYSYKYDENKLKNSEFIILSRITENSKFKNGIWLNGNFYGGYFGNIENNKNYDKTIWKNGNVYGGIFQNCKWENGVWKGEKINNCKWLNGNFYKGEFNGDIWEDGTWLGGDFTEGIWYNGVFNSLQNIRSRFGVYKNTDVNETKCIWMNGRFKNGEFHSGLFLNNSGETIPSNNNKISVWENGIFDFGIWYGGQFKNGELHNVIWYTGIWGTWSTDWKLPNDVFQLSGYSDFSILEDEEKFLDIHEIGESIQFHFSSNNSIEEELIITGQTYTEENKINEINDLPPYFYYNSFGYFITGTTGMTDIGETSFTEDDIVYFKGTDKYEYTGKQDMECKTNYIYQSTEGDTHIIDLDIEIMDNLTDVKIRMLDENGNIAGYYDDGTGNTSEYISITNSGATNNIYFINNQNSKIFFDFVTSRDDFNSSYELKINFYITSYIKSRLTTIQEKERVLYENDIIKVNAKHEISDELESGTTNYQYYLVDENDNIISNELTFSGSTGATFEQDKLILSEFAEKYKLKLNIFQDNTYNFETFKSSSINIKLSKIIKNQEWKNLNNLTKDDESYSYFEGFSNEYPVNLLIVSGFSFNIPDNSIIKGFKLKITRGGFFEKQEQILGGIIDNGLAIDFENISESEDFEAKHNVANTDKYYSSPDSNKKEEITYGNYENFLGYNQSNWNLNKVNNLFKIIYQPSIIKSLSLSPKTFVQGRIYKIEAKVFYQTKPIWYNGQWINGIWINGDFRNGTMKNVNWVDGNFSGKLNI